MTTPAARARPADAELRALRQALDGENLRAMRAEAKVRELEAVIAQLRRAPTRRREG